MNNNVINKINGINFKYVSSINIPKNITFGTEIEFVNARFYDVKWKLAKRQRQNKLSNYKLEKESTVMHRDVRNNVLGGELVTPILNDSINSWKTLKYACDFLIKMGAKIDRNCSNHIHIGINIFENNLDYFIRFLKVWTIYEDIIYYFSCNEQLQIRNKINSYAKEIGMEIFKMFEQKYTKTEIIDKLKFILLDKTYALRFSTFETLEIRVPAGTLNSTIIQNNISFFIKLILYCKSNYYNEKLINEKFSLHDKNKSSIFNCKVINLDKALELSNLIYTTELEKLNFLRQYLKLFNKKEKNTHTKKYIYS